ncbi:restriction endonuclease subunit S [Endozoicomonas sp. ALC020]|uniref:restriction endonuclease subunit S n=1 Tax=unclassified Endozoicomonas TaxID=2644528 RepID=UPI003BAE94E0
MDGNSLERKKYAAYPEYKDSGVEWLSSIPKHWNLKKVRYVLKDGSEGIKIGPFGSALKLDDMAEHGHNVYGQENVIKKDFSLGKRKITTEKFQEMSLYQVFPNDILITMMGTSGKCEIVPEGIPSGIIDSHLLRTRVKEHEIDPRFFKILIDETHEIGFQIKTLGKGSIMHGLNSGIVKDLVLPLPDRVEQDTILRFLDHETAKIDTLIEEQQSLIRLLKEKRQAVISHAVTKGLNPDAPMKDSGVEWLGEVPEHWEVKRLKHVADVVDCRNKTPEYFDDGEYFVVRTTNVKNQKLNFNGALYTDERNFKIWTQRGIPPAGSILFTREAPAGEICLVPENLKFCLGQRMMNFISHDPDYKSFLFDFLLSDCLERYIESVSHGSTVTHLRVEQVENIPVIVPLKEEAEAIHSYLRGIKSKYEELTHEAEQAIALMQEHRTVLISAAVTGKIDVRDWVAPP